MEKNSETPQTILTEYPTKNILGIQKREFDEEEVEEEIAEEIFRIEKYDFKVSNVLIDKNTFKKRFTTQYNFKNCPSCKLNFPQKTSKTHVSIKYQIQDIKDKKDIYKYPYIFRFNVQIKLLECKSCKKQTGQLKISIQELHRVSNQFIKIVHDFVEQHVKYKQGLVYWYDDWKYALDLVKKLPTGKQAMYNAKQAQDQIYLALKDIKKYNLEISTKRFSPKQKYKKCIRCVYIRLICRKCPKINKDNQWTSICGTFQIRFIANKKKHTVKFNVRIYTMQCLQCLQYGKCLIYDSQLKGIEMQFAHIISEIMDGVPPPKKRKQPKQIPDIHHHKKQFCEACQKGRCVSQNIKKQWDKQTKRVNNKIETQLDLHTL